METRYIDGFNRRHRCKVTVYASRVRTRVFLSDWNIFHRGIILGGARRFSNACKSSALSFRLARFQFRRVVFSFLPSSLCERRFSAFTSTSVARIANSVCLIHAARYARELPPFFHRVLISRHDDEAVGRRAYLRLVLLLFVCPQPSAYAVVSTVSPFLSRESEIIARSHRLFSLHFRQALLHRSPTERLVQLPRASGG